MRRFLKKIRLFLSQFCVCQNTQASGYQTWYLGEKNVNGESIETYLGKTSRLKLQKQLEEIGIELEVIEKSLDQLEPKMQKKMIKPFFWRKVELLLEHRGFAIGIPFPMMSPHHLRILLDRSLDRFSDQQVKELHCLIQRISALMQSYIGHAHFVLVKGENWIDLIGCQEVESLDFEERCWRLRSLCNGCCLKKEKDSKHKQQEQYTLAVALWKEILKKPKPEVIYPEEVKELKFTQVREGLLTTLAFLAEAFREAGFSLMIEERGELPQFLDSLTVPMTSCAFCRESVIANQCAYSGEHAMVIYNYTAPIERSAFLVCPKRHCPRVEELTPDEAVEMLQLERIVIQILEESFGKGTVIAYTQNTMPAGQTVPHTHTKIEYKTPIIFSLSSLFYILQCPTFVEADEMTRVTNWMHQAIQEQKKEAA